MKNLLLCIAVLSMTTVAYAQDKLTPGPGEVELTYVGKGTQLGVWNPTTKVYTIPIKYKEGPLAGQYRSLTFTEDGKVLNGEGTEVGSKQPDGSWKTAQMEKVFRSSYNVFWKTEIVGTILETMVSIHGLPMVQTSSTMDQDVLTFLVFCNHYATRLDKIKEEVQKDNDRRIAEAQAKEAKQPPQNFDGTILDKDNFRVYTIKSDGQVVDKNYNRLGEIRTSDNKYSYSVLDKNFNFIGEIRIKDNEYEVYDKKYNFIGVIRVSGNDYNVLNKDYKFIGVIRNDGEVYDKDYKFIRKISNSPKAWIGALFFFGF